MLLLLMVMLRLLLRLRLRCCMGRTARRPGAFGTGRTDVTCMRIVIDSYTQSAQWTSSIAGPHREVRVQRSVLVTCLATAKMNVY